MGPCYDTSQLHKFVRTPEDVRLLEGRHLDVDGHAGGNIGIIFGAAMFVLAVVAYSIELVGEPVVADEIIEVADHSSRP
ncbi:MAG: hypothetical protein AAF557_10710 [Pseudomonadota bacterium]